MMIILDNICQIMPSDESPSDLIRISMIAWSTLKHAMLVIQTADRRGSQDLFKSENKWSQWTPTESPSEIILSGNASSWKRESFECDISKK